MRTNTVVEEVLGDAVVTGVRTRTTTDGTATDVELAALFVYVGLAPETAWLDGVLELDPSGRIPTDDRMRTPSSWPVCGRDGSVRIGRSGGRAAGDGATAAVAADRY